MTIRSLWQEVRWRKAPHIIGHIQDIVWQKSGLHRRRFPSRDPQPELFVKALKPGLVDSLDAFVDYFDNRTLPVFFFDHNEQEAIRRNLSVLFPDNTALLAAAQKVVDNRFSFLGSPEACFDDGVNWHHYLQSEGEWPRVHWSLINIRNSNGLDVKPCWEWNRHQFFVTLGRAYRHTGDEHYVSAFVRLLESWCAQNPPETGVHWLSNLELGLRCVSWLWAHHLMAPSETYTMKARGKVHLFIYLMAEHIAKRLSFSMYTARNNHLIADASCLAVVALMYPELKQADAWLKQALKQLWIASKEQLFADGMHYEMSFGYHRFVFYLLLQVGLLLRRQDRASEVAPWIWPQLEKMVEVLMIVRRPDGSVPNFGDNDDGRLFMLNDLAVDNYDHVFSTAAVLFRRDDFKYFSKALDEETFWLLGVDGVETYRHLNSLPPSTTNYALRHAGLYVMRSGWQADSHYALFNNHPNSFPASGHNHASLLQLLLSVEGEKLLIDSGTFVYNSYPDWRNALRSTFAHNTVVVDQASQSIPHRVFSWLYPANPKGTNWQEGDNFVLFEGAHDGYERFEDPVTHRRIVVWIKEPCCWIIHDLFLGKSEHKLEQLWHLPARPVHWVEEEMAFYVQGEYGPDVIIKAIKTDRENFSQVTTDVPWAWESPSYGVRRRKNVLKQTLITSLPGSMSTIIYSENLPAPPEIERIDDHMLRIEDIGVLQIPAVGAGKAQLLRTHIR